MADSNTPVPDTAPHPGTSITQDTPTKAYREGYIKGVEFDHSEATWDKLVDEFPAAWEAYYNETQPSYSEENSVKFGEAIRFWQYMNVGETITYSKEFNENTYGNGEDKVATYAPEGADSGTYSHPDGFYNPEVYANTLGPDNELPRVEYGGERVIGLGQTAEFDDGVRPVGTELFSDEYTDLTEYKTTHRPPNTPYEWGGPYAIGGKYKLSNDS